MDTSRIKEYMKVVGSDGQPVGTVDCLKDEKVILTKRDAASGGKHHSIPLDWVSSVEDNQVRLNLTTENAQQNWTDVESSAVKGESKIICPLISHKIITA